MKSLIFVVLLLTAGCALRSREAEEIYTGNECSTASISVYVNNLPPGISPSQITVVVKDAAGAQIAMTRASGGDANFSGRGPTGKDYSAYLFLDGAPTGKQFSIGFAGAYCDYNSNYDYQTGQSVTAI